MATSDKGVLELKLLSSGPHRKTREDIMSLRRSPSHGPHIRDKCSREVGKHEMTSARGTSCHGSPDVVERV